MKQQCTQSSHIGPTLLKKPQALRLETSKPQTFDVFGSSPVTLGHKIKWITLSPSSGSHESFQLGNKAAHELIPICRNFYRYINTLLHERHDAPISALSSVICSYFHFSWSTQHHSPSSQLVNPFFTLSNAESG
jgi:hypothetical protein